MQVRSIIRVLANKESRVLALDVGKRRIGLAISDELGLMAQGLETLHRTRIRDDLGRLRDLAQQLNVGTLLIGRPLHMSGDESRQSEYTREFAERLEDSLNLPVIYWDERLTSMQAERMLRSAGVTTDRRAGTVDRMAAVLLLDSFLEHRRLSKGDDEAAL